MATAVVSARLDGRGRPPHNWHELSKLHDYSHRSARPNPRCGDLLELNLANDGFKTLSRRRRRNRAELLASEPVHLVLYRSQTPPASAGSNFCKRPSSKIPLCRRGHDRVGRLKRRRGNEGWRQRLRAQAILARRNADVVHKELDNSRCVRRMLAARSS